MYDFMKAVAMLCQIIAGDNPSIGRVDENIKWEQAKCHAFYGKCLNNNAMNWKECMQKRLAEMEKVQNDRLKK